MFNRLPWFVKVGAGKNPNWFSQLILGLQIISSTEYVQATWNKLMTMSRIAPISHFYVKKSVVYEGIRLCGSAGLEITDYPLVRD